MRNKTAEQMWEEFVEHYMPKEDEEILLDHLTPFELTPSPGGKECLGNGLWPGYECQCPDCDWYETICFPTG